MSREEVVSARGTSVWRAIGLHMLRAYDASWWRRCPRMSRDNFLNWSSTDKGDDFWMDWLLRSLRRESIEFESCPLVRR